VQEHFEIGLVAKATPGSQASGPDQILVGDANRDVLCRTGRRGRRR
jgi:hypothetical protein